ncbi:Undecaprenyl-phosphate galactose phosphotransferase, WbaP/exopolysaccharide biosynthesis polyprenyl glycosylphosphotransferase [Nakamurella panacisegetis]|uniref:Undecaprenyl-phosphate galactose phosphotransferase, WbaP/exopolysaccharide biosynthesis polyprenyl glycosylphosphotransferase n=1 Tax=Nakamurella panacisegetis TaxID=1090615 RepID=A0A1H0II75_9ACTN|nr:sugar transferase [Nakamurella panacisegetis]SDO31093.1 Undecaprenyl-phosphate galactose phosphotransferase, WbaP/exopolysaccharide biosynthesis polyprenyl glycosylphosphotransferase [Nakamurella panacisegetis]
MTLSTSPRSAQVPADGRPLPASDERGALRAGAPADAASRGLPWARRYAIGLFVSDVVVVTWAAVGAHTIRLGSLTTRVSRAPDQTGYVLLTVGLVLLWLVGLHWGGSREKSVLGYGPEEYKRVVQSTVTLFGLVAICSYVFDLNLPRVYVLVVMPAGLVALTLSRFIWRRWLHAKRLAGEYQSKVLVVGNVHSATELTRSLRRAPLAGYRVIGICTSVTAADQHAVTQQGGTMSVDGFPVLGTLTDVAGVATACGADVVAVTATASFSPDMVRKLGWELESTDIDLVLAPALTNIAGPRVHTTPIAGLPLIHVDRPTYRGANRIVKKSFDIVGALVLILLLSPVLLGLAVSIKLTDRGSIFFRQERVGLNGKSFRMVKFRSMVPNAEDLLADLRRSSRDAGNDILFKLRDDPRVTKIGRVLRRFSLDELPQLFNVLKGDMSLVGPRPPLRTEVDVYGDDARLRLLVKPGMTGLWQVSGRSNLTWEETVRLDVYYVENWSITGDLVILWKTAKAVVASSGAY